MAGTITFVSIQGVVNFLTLRPTRYSSVTVGHSPLSRVFHPLSRVHRVENLEENIGNEQGTFGDASHISLADFFIKCPKNHCEVPM